MTSGRSRPNPVSYVGTIHNQAMDYTLRQLKRSSDAHRGEGGLTKDDYFRISEASLNEFFAERRVGRLRAEEARSWRALVEKHPHASARELASILSLRDQHVGAGGVELSSRAWDYLDEILFIADVAVDMNQLQSQLWSVEARASNELLGTDLEAVYATSAVTQSSATYWEANYDQWTGLCAQDRAACTGLMEPLAGRRDGPTIQRINGWKVLGSDVVGCVGGYLTGLLAGCAVGAGVGSVSSAIGQM